MRIAVRGVNERDLDLLILEEVVASATFRRSFLAALGIPGEPELIEAARSVPTSNGESDLELAFRDGETVFRVLLENKLDAVLQPKQAERYRDRAEVYVQSGKASRVVTVLAAPETYQHAEGAFDYRITYEAMDEWFQQPADERIRYKRHVLREALARAASGWTLVPDDRATLFWKQYWDLACIVAPKLNMKRPGTKPSTSSFVYFRPAGLPSDVRLIHKVPYGHVDLQFEGMANRLGELDARYGPLLPPGLTLARAHKSAVIRTLVDRVSLEEPFDAARERVTLALVAALEAVDWFCRLDRTG